MCDSTNITLDLSNGLIRHASFRYSVYTVQISTIDLFCTIMTVPHVRFSEHVDDLDEVISRAI